VSLARGLRFAVVLPIAAYAVGPVFRRAIELPVTVANSNVSPAGVLRDGVLNVSLEAKRTVWRIDGEEHAPLVVEAFAEQGARHRAR
jgi:hypothetical protein